MLKNQNPLMMGAIAGGIIAIPNFPIGADIGYQGGYILGAAMFGVGVAWVLRRAFKWCT